MITARKKTKIIGMLLTKNYLLNICDEIIEYVHWEKKYIQLWHSMIDPCSIVKV